MDKVVRKEKSQIVDKLTGISLACYAISTIAFEGNPRLSIISSTALYIFLGLGMLDIIVKRRLNLNYYLISRWIFGTILAATFFMNRMNIASQTLYWYFTCTIITVLAVNYLNAEDKIHLVLKSYVWAGIILCIVALSYYGFDVFEYAATSKYGIRVGGEFGNENDLGMSCAFSVIIALYFLLFRENEKLGKIFFASSIILCFAFALLTGSKKAVILIVLGVMILFLLKQNTRKSIISRFGYLMIGLVCVYGVYLIIQEVDAFWYVGHRIKEMYHTLAGNSISTSDQTRLFMIKHGLAAFMNRPIFGHGVAYSYAMFGTYSHNNFIELLISTGIFGAIIYYSSYMITMKRLFKNIEKSGLWVIIFIIAMSIPVLEFGMVSYYNRPMQILLAATSAYISIQKGENSESSKTTKKSKWLYQVEKCVNATIENKF